MRKCNHCGRDIEIEAAFCPSCGAPIGDVIAQAEPPKGNPFSKRTRKQKAKKAKEELAHLDNISVVKTTNELCGFDSMYANGVAEVYDGVFSASVRFEDVPFEHEREDVQNDVFDRFCELHRSFGTETTYQINLLNIPNRVYEASRVMPEVGLNAEAARAYNDLLEERQRAGRTEFTRVNMITYSTAAASDSEAARVLSTQSENIIAHLGHIHSSAHLMDGMERLQILHDLIRTPAQPFTFDYSMLKEKGAQGRAVDALAPAWVAYTDGDKTKKDTLTFPTGYVRVYYLRDLGSELRLNTIRDIRSLPIPMNISLTYCPQPTAEMLKRIRMNIDTLHSEMIDSEKSLARSGANIVHVPPALGTKEADQLELMDFITDKDQTISYFQGLICVWAETREKMELYETLIMDKQGSLGIEIDRLPLDQEQAFISSLPLAHPVLERKWRSLATAECAALLPFAAQNLADEGNCYYLGVNAITSELIKCNPDKTKSPHMWVLGYTGAGKGMQVKYMLDGLVLAHPKTRFDDKAGIWVCDDPDAPQIHIIDWHSEYAEHAKKLGGMVRRFGAAHDSCINILDMSAAQGNLTMSAVKDNANFFMALLASVLGQPLTNEEKTVIDRALQDTFMPHADKQTRPDLTDFYNVLSHDPSAAAKPLAEALALYVSGSFSSFAHQTNFVMDGQLNVYDCSELGSQMQTLALLAILQNVRNCTYKNFRQGKPTYLFAEEIQIMFGNDELVDVLDSFCSEMRKFGLHMVMITQLPDRILSHPRARALFENASIFVFLAQHDANADMIADMFRLSATQRNRISPKAQAGTGLVVADGVTVSMRNRIPTTSPLYEAWNTDPNRVKVQAPSVEETLEYLSKLPRDRMEEVMRRIGATQDEIEEVLISELDMSSRWKKHLLDAGIETANELSIMPLAALTEIDGIGNAACREIAIALSKRGFTPNFEMPEAEVVEG